jgi:hypothetical protein
VTATPIKFTNTLRDALRVTGRAELTVAADHQALQNVYVFDGAVLWHVRQWMDDGSSSSNNNHLRFLVDDVPATSSHKATAGTDLNQTCLCSSRAIPSWAQRRRSAMVKTRSVRDGA